MKKIKRARYRIKYPDVSVKAPSDYQINVLKIKIMIITALLFIFIAIVSFKFFPSNDDSWQWYMLPVYPFTLAGLATILFGTANDNGGKSLSQKSSGFLSSFLIDHDTQKSAIQKHKRRTIQRPTELINKRLKRKNGWDNF